MAALTSKEMQGKNIATVQKPIGHCKALKFGPKVKTKSETMIMTVTVIMTLSLPNGSSSTATLKKGVNLKMARSPSSL